MRAVIRHLRAAALCCKGDGPTDGQLLESFIIRREETAFEALVRRHGPMVFGVCRRILHNVHDAEDAFQATFLVLSRKASTVKPRDMVGNWLYGVAYRTAMKSRAMRLKRQAKERRGAELSRVEAPSGAIGEELLMQLDHELNRLPDRYRVPVVLCELEGRSRREAAQMLGIPEGTLSSRLAQAKTLLARKLSRYGTISLTALISASVASASLTPAVRASALKVVFSAEAVSVNVLALTEGVMKAMLLSKLKITVCAAILMLVAGVGATGLTYRATAQEPKRGFASRPQSDDLESLRLEIEALRKELRATRERVKALEEEMRGQKGRNAAEPKQPLRFGVKERVRSELEKELESARREIEKEMKSARREVEKEMKSLPGAVQISDILSKVEEELQKTLEKTTDKQVAEALEQALKGLRERDKAKVPGKGKPKEKR